MNQKSIIIVALIVVILVGGYLGRHQIKSMMGMAPTPAPVAMTPQTTTPTSSSMPANSITTTRTDAAKGSYLADSKGMTLYTYDKDTQNTSNCTAGCLAVWPAFVAPMASPTDLPSGFGVITRADGTFQYTDKGLPLYYYAKDTKPGDVTGDGVGGIWHIVTP